MMAPSLLSLSIFPLFPPVRLPGVMSLWSAATRATRDTQQALLKPSQASPKTATLPALARAPVTSVSVMWPRGGRGPFREQHRGEAQRGGGAWPEQAGVRRYTRPWHGNSASSRPCLLSILVPNCYWFLKIRVILLVTESNSKSLRTSLNDFTSSRHHPRSRIGNCLHRKVRYKRCCFIDVCLHKDRILWKYNWRHLNSGEKKKE